MGLMSRGPPRLAPSPNGRSVGSPAPKVFLRHHFQPVLARAGLRHMPFHDLRHSAATLLKEPDPTAGPPTKWIRSSRVLRAVGGPAGGRRLPGRRDPVGMQVAPKWQPDGRARRSWDVKPLIEQG